MEGLKLGSAANLLKPDSEAAGEIEPTARRPRGRPAGSRNKPKPPVVCTREFPDVLRPIILEIGDGNDVVEAISRFARRRQRGFCVLAAAGAVSDVTLRQFAGAGDGHGHGRGFLTLRGRFVILSLSAVFLPPPAPPIATNLSVILGDSQGQTVGGNVAGALIASGTVILTTASFANVAYEKLQVKEEEEKREKGFPIIPPAPVDGFSDHHLPPIGGLPSFNLLPY